MLTIKQRNSVQLTELLLSEIQQNVRSFKPSQSLSMLSELDDDARTAEPAAEIDLVISGGGMKGYFMTGCASILMNELNKRHIRVARIAGASAGAWSAMLMCCGFTTAYWIETYYCCKEGGNKTIHESYNDMWESWMKYVIPEDAYLRCSGRLFISITEVTPLGCKNWIVSEFTSNRDLFEACLASSTIPFVSERWGMRKYRGKWVIDGGVTNNSPVFQDSLHRQLVFKLTEVDYSWWLMTNPADTCIEGLVLRGAMLMAQFLEGSPTTEIVWLDRDEEKKKRELQKQTRRIIPKRIFVPAVLSGLAVLYLSGVTRMWHELLLQSPVISYLESLFVEYLSVLRLKRE